jgi:hypothetical protein
MAIVSNLGMRSRRRKHTFVGIGDDRQEVAISRPNLASNGHAKARASFGSHLSESHHGAQWLGTRSYTVSGAVYGCLTALHWTYLAQRLARCTRNSKDGQGTLNSSNLDLNTSPSQLDIVR